MNSGESNIIVTCCYMPRFSMYKCVNNLPRYSLFLCLKGTLIC